MNKNKILSEKALSLIGSEITILKDVNVDYFGYREFLNDGSSIGFCTHQNWNYLQNKPHISENMSDHYRKELFELGNSNVKYLVRYGEAKDQSYYLNLLNNWQLWNSLVVYKREHNKVRGYYFISSDKNIKVINSYMNNISFIDNITNVIRPKIDNLVANCHKEFYEKLFDISDAKLIIGGRDFISETSNKNHIEEYCYAGRYEQSYFTEMQNKIVQLLIQKYSNKRIAEILNIALRTVEWHLVNIKRKTTVKNRQELINFLSASYPK